MKASRSKGVRVPHNYTPRVYQIPFWRAMDPKGKNARRALLTWHRRAGKDITCANFMISRMPQRKGAYYYYFPTMAQGRKILWDGRDKDGRRLLLDHFPPGSIVGKPNESEMKIKTVWGSLFQIVGTDRLEVVGPNPVGCVFSEFSLQNPRGWNYVRPILAENEGWAVFNGTPRGRNHHHRLFEMANGNPDWFCQLLTVDHTKAIQKRAIDTERRAGMSEELIQQEFFCSWDSGLQGAYYGRPMAKMRQDGRIVADLPYDRNYLVHTAWDLGIGDSTSIWWFQEVGPWIHALDYYENSGEGMEHYVRTIRERKEEFEYEYGNHFAPFDVTKRELGTGVQLLDTASDLGLSFYTLPREKRVVDGIERVRRILPRVRMHAKRCEFGIECLEHYQKSLNEHMSTEYRPVYSETPEHSWPSHRADAFRYLSMALPYTDTSSEYYSSSGENGGLRPTSCMVG